MTEDPYKDKLYVKKLEPTHLSSKDNVTIVIEEYSFIRVFWKINNIF